MKTIQAIYENGVFRPITPVDLPEGFRVSVEMTDTESSPGQSGRADDDHLDAIYEILSHSYETGETDLAARHDEHQP